VHNTTTFFLVTLPNIHRFKNITARLSNKPFLIWLLTTPLHLKYAARLPCNLSLIACILTLMFYKVAWQEMISVMWFLITTLLQIYYRMFRWKKIENQLRFDKIVAMNLWPHFCPTYKFARRCCGFTAERSAGRRCLSIAARRSAENAGSATLTADIGSWAQTCWVSVAKQLTVNRCRRDFTKSFYHHAGSGERTPRPSRPPREGSAPCTPPPVPYFEIGLLASVGAPELTTRPEDVDVSSGDTAYFNCQADGDPRPQIVWYRNR